MARRPSDADLLYIVETMIDAIQLYHHGEVSAVATVPFLEKKVLKLKRALQRDV